jgi:hypothetical protein
MDDNKNKASHKPIQQIELNKQNSIPKSETHKKEMRKIPIDCHRKKNFCDNEIKTAKYNA